VIVADASAILEVLLRSDRGLAAERRLLRRGESIHAPSLIDLEIAQVLRRYVARGELAPSWAWNALAIAAVFPIQRYLHEPLLPRVWELRANLTAYDAAYVALAEGLRAPLLTCDARIAKAAGIRAAVELIEP